MNNKSLIFLQVLRNFDLCVVVSIHICQTIIIWKRIVRMDKILMYYFYGCGSTRILEKLMCRSCGLYLTTIRIIESNNIFRDDLLDSDTYRLWYDCLGYPGRDMMIRILKTSHGHSFYRANRSMNQKLIQGGEKDVTDMPKNWAFDVKVPATGRLIPATGRPFPERSADRSSILATGRPKRFFYL